MVQKMIVKVCGITNPEDALLCADAGADILGFIFYEKSKRYISPEKAAEIVKRLPATTRKAGVFVNCNAEIINETASIAGIDTVQLHGDEQPSLLERIKVNKIKAFRVREGFDFDMVRDYEPAIPLFDSFSEREYGGTGRKFNWGIIPREFSGKYFLSGGISIDNIEEAVNELEPFAVDLSSSLELSPGKKDPRQVNDFFELLYRKNLR
ncbi:MAG: phosphoribosylanthranilate isomerase [Bacteroidetes bacterium]|nr:phosphoribosylanthranilate isomerase [Bacteroidota bacterium]